MLVNFIHVPKNGGISIKEICRKTNNNPLKYNPHYADIYDPRVSNQLIVLRDPVDRLISAIRYTIKSFYLMCEGEEHNHRLDYDQRKHLKTHRVPTFVGKNKARLFRAVFNRGTQTPNDWITRSRRVRLGHNNVSISIPLSPNLVGIMNQDLLYLWIIFKRK